MRSLQLLGSREVWRKLILKHSQRQEYRIPNCSEKFTCKLLLVTGKGRTKSVRISKAGLDVFEKANPDAVFYFNHNYFRHNHAGEKKRIDRFHRVAEATALVRMAGIETRPFVLPMLQMFSIDRVVPDEPSFYLSKELKYFGGDDVNKISFSRITGALFYPGGCYAVYNSRDYLMNWNGKGELKVKAHLTEIARMNAGVDDVTSALLLGSDYSIAEVTLRSLEKIKCEDARFDTIYDHLHFITLDRFGSQVLKMLTLPDWKEAILEMLFDSSCRSYNLGNFEYDALVDGVYVISFLDGDITRLNRFRKAILDLQEKTSVVCFPEQAEFIQQFLGPRTAIKIIHLRDIASRLGLEGCDGDG